MTRTDWYGGLRWITERDSIPASVAARVVLEAGEASDRLRAIPQPKPREWTEAELALWRVLRATLSAEDARQAFVNAIRGRQP